MAIYIFSVGSYVVQCVLQLKKYFKKPIIVHSYTQTFLTCDAATATLPEHLISPSFYNGFRVAQSLVFCVVYGLQLLVFVYLFPW